METIKDEIMEEYELFTKHTQAIVYGYKPKTIQRMLDFDFISRRTTPSVVAVIRPTQMEDISYYKAFWGGQEILIPI